MELFRRTFIQSVLAAAGAFVAAVKETLGGETAPPNPTLRTTEQVEKLAELLPPLPSPEQMKTIKVSRHLCVWFGGYQGSKPYHSPGIPNFNYHHPNRPAVTQCWGFVDGVFCCLDGLNGVGKQLLPQPTEKSNWFGLGSSWYSVSDLAPKYYFEQRRSGVMVQDLNAPWSFVLLPFSESVVCVSKDGKRLISSTAFKEAAEAHRKVAEALHSIQRERDKLIDSYRKSIRSYQQKRPKHLPALTCAMVQSNYVPARALAHRAAEVEGLMASLVPHKELLDSAFVTIGIKPEEVPTKEKGEALLPLVNPGIARDRALYKPRSKEEIEARRSSRMRYPYFPRTSQGPA